MGWIVGCHVEPEIETVKRLYGAGLRAFQFFIGTTTHKNDYSVLRPQLLALRAAVPEDALFVVHAPFWWNLLKTPAEFASSRTRDDLQAQIEIAQELQAYALITHVGYRGTNETLQRGKRPLGRAEALENLMSSLTFAEKVIDRDGPLKLLIENTPGSANGLQAGGLQFLTTVVDRGPVGVKLCFDTQHAWARGEDMMVIDKRQPDWRVMRHFLTSYAQLVHLNANPRGSKFGGFVDDHAKVKLTESDGLTPTDLLEVANESAKLNIPVILERGCSEDIIMSDVEFLLERGDAA